MRDPEYTDTVPAAVIDEYLIRNYGYTSPAAARDAAATLRAEAAKNIAEAFATVEYVRTHQPTNWGDPDEVGLAVRDGARRDAHEALDEVIEALHTFRSAENGLVLMGDEEYQPDLSGSNPLVTAALTQIDVAVAAIRSALPEPEAIIPALVTTFVPADEES